MRKTRVGRSRGFADHSVSSLRLFEVCMQDCTSSVLEALGYQTCRPKAQVKPPQGLTPQAGELPPPTKTTPPFLYRKEWRRRRVWPREPAGKFVTAVSTEESRAAAQRTTCRADRRVGLLGSCVVSQKQARALTAQVFHRSETRMQTAIRSKRWPSCFVSGNCCSHVATRAGVFEASLRVLWCQRRHSLTAVSIPPFLQRNPALLRPEPCVSGYRGEASVTRVLVEQHEKLASPRNKYAEKEL